MIRPSATYRVQLSKNFTFRHLEQIIDYLHELGISTIYASPIFKAMNGSDHGYDVVNPHTINDEIGTLDEFRSLSKKLKAKGFTWIQDIVPNHMSIISTNYKLWDVLERGRASAFENYFDIDWEHPQLKNKLLLPFLEAELHWCIDNDKVKIHYAENGFQLSYYQQAYPVNIESYELLLQQCSISTDSFEKELHYLFNQKNETFEEWKKAKEQFLKLLSTLGLEKKIIKGVEKINTDKQLIKQIADTQHYKPEWYEVADKMINYRRFFTINNLICVRIEDETVFNDYHTLIKQLYDEGLIQGLRIDHIDGLKDPATYIDRLKKLLGNDCYVIAEKILEIKEQLPQSFHLEGTSGYEFLSYINQVLTDINGSEKLVLFYEQIAADFKNYYNIVFDKKFSFLKNAMHGEWNNLYRLLLSLKIVDNTIIEQNDLQKALGIVMAAFPVYRIYINEFPLDDISKAIVEKAFDDARKRFPHLLPAFNALQNLFSKDAARPNERLLFLQRLMQFTGPLAAKGVEDTTFYLYNPLISHNEVGDLPCVLGITVEEFHEKMQQRQILNPLSLNNTSTHDTKRGEDARIRINVLSELTDEWIDLVKFFIKENVTFKKQVEGTMSPVVNDEYFLYQSIVGGFAEDLTVNAESVNRLKGFFIKALREAKFISTHTRPHAEYEQACIDFIDALFNSANPFMQKIVPFVQKVKSYAEVYTLSQVVIKSTAPGIPDYYQGCELWDLSYVDPDNRRQVNYNIRKQMLYELTQKEKTGVKNALCWARENRLTGGEKLFVTKKILQYRKANNEMFIDGEYIPLECENAKRKAIAYARKNADKWLLVIIPTGIAAQKKGWSDIKIPLPQNAPAQWKNIFTEETILTDGLLELKEIFNLFPVAVLESV